jgi:tetratricopeptide (TPR) repeat protein
METSLHEQIELTITVLGENTVEATVVPALEPLDELFAALHGGDNTSKRAEAEDLIWALWSSHEDVAARNSLNHAIGAISRGELDQAETLLDALVISWPQWAEAWNKRATLYFLREQFLESVKDIKRTLELEPRHFGALSGFGQICLHVGDEHSALIAFDFALRANPTLNGVRNAADGLRSRVRRALH